MPSLPPSSNPHRKPPTPGPGEPSRPERGDRQRRTIPPIDPLGWSDAESAPRRGGLRPTRRDLAIAGALLGAGIAWGAALLFAGSLPIDFGFLLFVLQFGVGLVFVIGLVLMLVFRGFNVDRVLIVAALVMAGATLGLRIGPTVAPAATVVGSYTYTPALPAAPPSEGTLACEWAKGRWRVGLLTTTTPIAGLPTAHLLTANLLSRQVQLADGASSTLLAVGDAAIAPPPGETARGAGDRTGAIAIDLLQVNLGAGSSEVNEVRGTFRWTCPGPPPG
jgi:hypothetical protein